MIELPLLVAVAVSRIGFVLPQDEMSGMRLATEMFQRRLSVRAQRVTFDEKGNDSPGPDEMSVLVSPYLSAARSPGTEGYVIDVRQASSGGIVAKVAGSDRLGLMFGLGALYRRINLLEDGVDVPIFGERSAPRYELRSVNQGVLKNVDDRVRISTKARKWTRAEAEGYQEELFLLGQNGITHGWGGSVPLVLGRHKGMKRSVNNFVPELAEKYGVKYVLTCSINGLGKVNMKEPWRAELFREKSAILACPSNPDARSAIVDARKIAAQHAPRIDYAMLLPGDVAGCDCAACHPWELTYYDLAVEIASAIHRFHPLAKVFVSNQEFQMDQNARFFTNYRLRQNPELSGYAYGPGSSENSFYGYVKPNRAYERFPGCLPGSTFLKSRLKYLSPSDKIVAFMDIGHWIRSQTGLTVVDPSWSETHGRRIFYARPKRLGQVWREVLPYVDLCVGYSESILDDFAKFFTLRLLWNPDLTDRMITREYAAMYAGENVADLLTDALFLHEHIVEDLMVERMTEIARCHKMAEEVWQRMSPIYRRGNWRVLLFRQRAALDAWLAGRLAAQKELYGSILASLEKLSGPPDSAAREKWVLQLRASHRPSHLERLLEYVRHMDDKLDQLAGLRSMELHRLLSLPDQIGAGWLASQLEQMKGADAARIWAETIGYDKVARGEFYDNCGTPGSMPHFDPESGEVYYGAGRLERNSRPSQRSYCFSGKALEGVRFTYEGLDKTVPYCVTFTYPNIKGPTFAMNSPNEFDVFADGVPIGHCVPSGDSYKRFRFSIPRQVTEDGRLILQFRPTAGRGVSTCISEVWIMKDKERETR